MDSESLVWGRIAEGQKNGLFSNGGLLADYRLDTNYERCYADDYYAANQMDQFSGTFTYTRQSGLQGTLYTMIAITLERMGMPNSTIQKTLWRVNAWLVVISMMGLVWWVYREIGWAGSVGTISCVILSPWLVMAEANLYWAIWTMIFPIVVVAVICRRAKQNDYQVGWKSYILVFVAFLVRFLCGFEFTSTIMLASEMPVLFYFLRASDKSERMFWIRQAFIIGVVEVCSFAAAILITVIQIMIWQGEGIASAASEIMESVRKRTGFNASEIDDYSYQKEIIESLKVGKWTVVRTYLVSPNELWAGCNLKEITFYFFLSVISYGCFCEFNIQKIVKQCVFFMACLTPALSWFILATAHSYIHTHINYILWLFPFLPFALAIMFQNGFETIKSLTIRSEKTI